MAFETFMLTVLPSINGVKPHISGSVFTSYRDRPKTNNRHGAVDFNYIGGQTAKANSSIPPAYSPVDGVVTFAGGSYGTVKIRDSKGYSHEILHMVKVRVKEGDSISAGTMIGRMAGKGPRGDFQYQIHIHYQLRKPDGTLIDPVAFWDGVEQTYTAPKGEEGLDDLDTHGDDPNHYHAEPGDPVGNIDEYTPRQAGVSSESGVGFALWTNRVPQHEPWPRTMMVDDPNLNTESDQPDYNTNHFPQFDDTSEAGSKKINRVEGEEVIPRGKFWRR